jgi:hypothetical protein
VLLSPSRYHSVSESANIPSPVSASLVLVFAHLQVTFPQLFLAIFLAAALQVLDLLLVPVLVNWWPVPDAANYVSWLSAIAQIGGVFIALYFTAVTAAAGAVYAQVPNNIRDLLARERVGNVYIRSLTQATFLPLCLVALHFLGLEPMRVAVPFLALVAGTGIIAFAALGRRAFDLFDPTRLAASLFGDLGGWLAQVSVGGFRLLLSSIRCRLFPTLQRPTPTWTAPLFWSSALECLLFWLSTSSGSCEFPRTACGSNKNMSTRVGIKLRIQRSNSRITLAPAWGRLQCPNTTGWRVDSILFHSSALNSM